MAFNTALATATDRVRFDVGDYSDAAPIIAEAIYTAQIARYPTSEARATIAMAEALIVKVSQDPDKVEVTGAVKVEWQNRLQSWRAIANALRAELGLATIGADSTMRIGYLVRSTDTSTEFGG